MRGVHCPECGTKANPGAAACAACGHVLPEEIVKSLNVAGGRTMVGVISPGLASAPVPPPLADDMPTLIKQSRSAGRSNEAQTNLGLSGDAQPRARMPSQLQNTIMGGAIPPEIQADLASDSAQKKTPAGTLIGVANPISSRAKPSDPNAPREMPHELGATLVPQPQRPRRPNRIGAERLDPDALLINRDKLARKRIHLQPVRAREEQARLDAQQRRRKILKFVIAGLFLLSGAGLLALFLTSSPPLSARVHVQSDGHDNVEITCSNCPDGTKVAIGDATGTLANHLAQIPLVAPLALGENRLKVTLDRPGRDRDETVGVAVNVDYRLRPDLSTLNADKPTLHVAVEAAKGTEITLDGQTVKIEDGPKAHPIDVSAECTGSSDEPATLKRRIAYSVKSPNGTRDDGSVEITVGIVSLRIDAPGPRVVTESDTFVLSGHTMKGAEVLVAGRPIQVNPDGSFAQRMSVSSIGATNIDVRAKIPGMAPRIVPIAVQRVESLDQAAKEFQKEKPVGYTTVALASASDVGRPVIVAGQIAEVRLHNHQTIYLLDVPAKDGCSKTNETCRVRLIQGATSTAKVGDSITAYGLIGRPDSSAGAAALPEIQVAFTLPGAAR